LTCTSAPLDNKYSTISKLPFSEAANQKIINVILMIFNIYSPKCKGVEPSFFAIFTSASFGKK
jgi:hypothetical protein